MAKKILSPGFFDDEPSSDIIDKIIREVENQPSMAFSTLVPPWTSEAPNETVKPLLTLLDIAKHFHKRLFENKETDTFLTKLGLTNKDAINLFKVGFIDQTIEDIVSETQKKYLSEPEILENIGSLTLPVMITTK